MAADDFEPKLGRIRDAKGRTTHRTTKRIHAHAGPDAATPQCQERVDAEWHLACAPIQA